MYIRSIRGFYPFIREMHYYAVARGHKIGIYRSWDLCKQQVDGYKGAKYKKFPTLNEAQTFINSFNQDDDTFQKQTSEKMNNDNEFWPNSDGDNVFENELTDNDLLNALSEVEGISSPKTSLKRSLTSASTKHASKNPKYDSIVLEPAGIKTIGSFDFLIDSEGYIIVYTDGSCLNNGAKHACAGFGVYFNENHPLNASKPVQGRVTNNVGEIQAAIYAIKIAKDLGFKKLCINTDSQFLINAITIWISMWKKKNWRLKNGESVKNIADFKELDELVENTLLNIKWNYVKGHKGIKGNEMADKLARIGAEMYRSTHLHNS